MSELTYLYQLQGASYSSLASSQFAIGVIDYEDTSLKRDQLAELLSSGKTLFSYLSIGEAEDYRPYWSQGNWSQTPPEFLMGPNPNWPGGYRVEFWEAEWQSIVTQRLLEIVKLGYEGVYFDLVDAYTIPEVEAEFLKEHPGGNIMKEMEDFVVRLSQAAKALNPNFKIIPQNAPELLNIGELNSPTDPLTPNARYLNAIDGLGKESTFTNLDQPSPPWMEIDRHYLENVLNAGKFVLAIEYPSDPQLQQQALQAMLNAGYVPFIGTLDLDGTVADINDQVPSLISASLVQKVTSDSTLPVTIVDSAADHVRLGNGGNDSILGDGGNDTLSGLAGNDWISLGVGNDWGLGGAGNDTIYALEGDDTVYGGSGNDIAFGWYGNDSMVGGDGNDFMTGDFGNDTLVGDAGDDGLYGWTGRDSINGGDGNDFLMGEQENDTLIGGAGNDVIYAGSEEDTVDGGAGDDYILGDDGVDTITAGSGNDTVFGGTGNDIITAGDGHDFIGGDADDDSIQGGAGNDTLYGWTGNDTLEGGDGSDLLSGENGNDLLLGGANDDVIYGGAGDDTLNGGTDDGNASMSNFTINPGDVLFGGAGADLFAHQKGGGVDWIVDFERGVDRIQLIGFGTNYNTAVKPNIVYINSQAWIMLGNNDALILPHIEPGSLTAADFVLF